MLVLLEQLHRLFVRSLQVAPVVQAAQFPHPAVARLAPHRAVVRLGHHHVVEPAPMVAAQDSQPSSGLALAPP